MSISATLSALYPNAPTLELRILKDNQIDSGYFNDYAKLEQVANKYNGNSQLYYTINPCNPALIARAANRVQTRVKSTTTDRDIIQRAYLPLDFDPIRPAGISATKDEHDKARLCALKAKNWLTSIGFPQPIEVDSGNGYYLTYAIDLPNDIETKELLQRVLQVLDMHFSTKTIKLDTGMFNASRIVRLPDTLNIKGDNTDDRPHRLARLCELPESLQKIPVELLRELASSLPDAPKPKELTQKLSLDNWLTDNDLTYSKERWNDNATRYKLDACPFNAEHVGGSAAIVQFDTGHVVFHCFHDSCATKTWKDVIKKLPLPEDGKTLSSKIIGKLNELGYYFRLNQCADRIEVNGMPITDALEAKILVQMTDLGFKGVDGIRRTIYANALDNSYHPVQDYLSALEYYSDRDYIAELASHLHDVHSPSVAYIWLKRWLVGAVAKVYEAEQNPMLVLDGNQGIGKSEFARYLCSGLPKFYIESNINPENNDHKIWLMQSWLWEVAELGATTHKSDVEALKSFITMREVTARPPYGHFALQKSALASFIGTVNDDGSGIFRDTTGNRRFLTMLLDSIDWNYTKVPIDRVWAQAVYLYRHGEHIALSTEEKAIQSAINDSYEAEDPYIGMLYQHFSIDPNDKDNWLSTYDILAHLKDHTNLYGDPKRQSMDLSKALKRLKLSKQRQGGIQGYYGIAPKSVLKLNFAKKEVKHGNN